jgi:hypothetical protein
MAFLFRGDDEHIDILDTLSKQLEIPTKHKVLLFIVEQYQKVIGERDEYYQKMNKYRQELKTLKAAIRATYDSEKQLKELVGVDTETITIDEKD